MPRLWQFGLFLWGFKMVFQILMISCCLLLQLYWPQQFVCLIYILHIDGVYQLQWSPLILKADHCENPFMLVCVTFSTWWYFFLCPVNAVQPSVMHIPNIVFPFWKCPVICRWAPVIWWVSRSLSSYKEVVNYWSRDRTVIFICTFPMLEIWIKMWLISDVILWKYNKSLMWLSLKSAV